jgi:5-methyltetrahydrofolate--homocysteine methyltransferase
MNLSKSYQELIACCNFHVLVLDGGIGAVLGQKDLAESDFRGKMFADHFVDLKGDNDVCLTASAQVKALHLANLEAGADLITTNTFGATSFGQAKYRLQHMAYDIAKAGAQVAKSAVQVYNTERSVQGKMITPKFVVGAMGPVSGCTPQAITFVQAVEAYGEQVRGLLDGGADVLMVDTAGNMADCKAALYAVCKECEKRGELFPIMVMGALWHSVSSLPIFSVGLTSGSGEEQLRRRLRDLSDAYVRVSVQPESPAGMAEWVRRFAEEPLANIVGGGSGATPETLRLMARALKGRTPRKVPAREHDLLLSGLDPMVVTPDNPFVTVARLVPGSAQHAEGAQVLCVNLDDGLKDSREAMTRFLDLLMADPALGRRPVMLESCRWDVLVAGMERLRGKGIVNSISLEEGEETFLAKAAEIHRFGFAVVCKAVDERGWACTFERRMEIIERMYRLLVGRLDFSPEDLLFDPNIFPVGVSIENCPDAVKDFMEVCRQAKEKLPHAHIVGDMPFLTLAFRGNNALRKCINTVFLFHAKQAGMDFGIMESCDLPAYEKVPMELRHLVEDVLFNRSPSATDSLLDCVRAAKKNNVGLPVALEPDWRERPAGERLRLALVQGLDQFVADDLEESLKTVGDPVQVVRGPLMEGMAEVYRLFAQGKLFFPQVEKSVAVLKRAVSALLPAIESERKSAAAPSARVVLASVDFGIHDIGKEILAEFFPCFGFSVTDLGLGCSCEKIVEETYREQPDVVWLSGLFVSSLDKMVGVAREFKSQGIEIPLVLGGVSTSAMHTAVKVAPEALGPVVYAPDPGKSVMVAEALIDTSKRGPFFAALKAHQDKLRARS